MSRNALLIVVEQFKRGGLETHIESEVRTLTAMGWDVHLALSEFGATVELPPDLKGILTGLDLGPLSTSDQLLLTADTLARYIERNGITAVHCHPFTSSLAAFLAAGKRGVGLAFTLHGPASLGAFYGDVFETFFRRFLLPQSGLVVCVSQEVAQIARLAGTSSATIVLPNPIRMDMPVAQGERNEGPLRILCAARLDAEKMPGIQDLLEKLPADIDWRMDIFGSGQSETQLRTFIESSECGGRVALRGWSDVLSVEMASYDLVAGMGRVVLEAAAADVAAMLVGYDGVKGLVDEGTFRNAAYANFSGRGLATIDAGELRTQLVAVSTNSSHLRLRSLVDTGFAEAAIWSAFSDRILAAAPAGPRGVELLHQALMKTRTSEIPMLQNQAIVELLDGSGHASTVRDETARENAVDFKASGEETVAVQKKIEFLLEALSSLEARLGEENRSVEWDDLKSSFSAAGADLSALQSQLSEIRSENAAQRDELLFSRHAFERIEQEWRALGVRLLQQVDAADAKMADFLAQVHQIAVQGSDTKADERWKLFLDEIKSQHAREVALLERQTDMRVSLFSEKVELADVRLNAAQAEIATLEEAIEATRLREAERDELARAALAAQEEQQRTSLEQWQAREADLLDEIAIASTQFDERDRMSREKWQAREADLLDEIAVANAQFVERETAPSAGETQAFKQIINSLEAQGSVLKQDVRELSARLAVADASSPSSGLSNVDGARFGVRGLVSIVLPVYNQANLIDEAIEGVLQQTYPDWELIIVDDGSKDDLQAVLSKYTTDRRIRFARQPNQKLPSALNSGNFFVRGEFLTWTSADNIMLPDQLAELVVALEANPDVGLAYSDYQAIDDRGAPLEDPDWRRHNRPDGSSIIRLPSTVTLENFHQSGDNFLGASFLWRAEIQAIVGPYDESTFGGEDYDMWLRMHLVTEFVHVPKVLYKYRVHDNTLNAKAKELDLFKNIRVMLDINQRRRETLLREQKLRPGVNGFLRDPGQYTPGVNVECEFLVYFELLAKQASSELLDDRIRVVTIDAPLRTLDLGVLADCDILVVPDPLTYSWLRQQELPRHIRLLAGDLPSLRPAVDHAAALCHFDRALGESGHQLASKPYAFPVASAAGEGIALLIQKWGVGGMEQVVLELASGFAARGARVSLCVVEGTVPEHLIRKSGEQSFSTVALDGDVTRLVAHCRANGIQLAHYHHCSLGCRELAAIGVRTVYTFHNSYIWFDSRERQTHGAAIAPMHAFIGVSREAASYGRKAFGLESPTYVIPNSTDIEGGGANAFDPTGVTLPEPRATRRFGFLAVGTMTPHKLHDRLVRAFGDVAAQIPNAHLTIVGSAQNENMYKRLMELRSALPDPSACSIIPGVRRADVISLMKSHHCLVMPSLIEGWSISLMEAVIAGMVCIASDVGAARDLAQKTPSVVLVPSPGGDVLDLNSERMWATIRSPLRGFERALTHAMINVAADFAVLDAAAKSSAPNLARAFALDAMVESHLHVYRQI